MIISRRSLLIGAPAVVAAASLMRLSHFNLLEAARQVTTVATSPRTVMLPPGVVGRTITIIDAAPGLPLRAPNDVGQFLCIGGKVNGGWVRLGSSGVDYDHDTYMRVGNIAVVPNPQKVEPAVAHREGDYDHEICRLPSYSERIADYFGDTTVAVIGA